MTEKHLDSQDLNIAVIKSQLDRMQNDIENAYKLLKDTNERTIRLENVKTSLEAHIVADRWLFGLTFTGIMAVIVKVIIT